MKQLAKLEQKLPAALKKAGVPQIAALVLLAVSVFGIGGAKLAGYYSSTMAGFNSGKYSITADLDQRVSAAANVVTVAKKIAGVDEALLTAAEDAVNALSEPLGPADTCAANETLDAAVEALYDAQIAPLEGGGTREVGTFSLNAEEFSAAFAAQSDQISIKHILSYAVRSNRDTLICDTPSLPKSSWHDKFVLPRLRASADGDMSSARTTP